jgi:hypothetical protein
MTKAVLTLVAVSLLLASPRAERSQPTWVAVVNGDGELTPIVYDGSTWWNRWPWGAESEEIRNLPVPRSLASIPKDWLPPNANFPLKWQALLQSGRLVPFRPQGLARRSEFTLMDTLIVQTTYRTSGNGDEDRLAISGPGRLNEFITFSHAEEDAILRQLAPRIASVEAEEIARWKEPPPAAQNADYGLLKGPHRSAGSTDYYLRGEKLFTRRPDDECMMRLSTEGFVLVDARGRVMSEKIAARASSEFCGDAGEAVSQLGTVTIGSRSWWVVKIDLEDGFDYGLIDPATGEPVHIEGSWDLRSNVRGPSAVRRLPVNSRR